jgi:putative DNA primase/helicase
MAVAVADKSGCPRWLTFLDRVTAGDEELQRYLQRMAGYLLTGSTKAQCFFFMHGGGANGKSVFVDTLEGLMGDYALKAGIETFTESHNDRHPTELAQLQGKRAVFVSETQAGSRWNEARIKSVTGDKKLSARFMRGDFFTFLVTFKLVVQGNRQPALRNVDEAIRRRLHFIPFTVEIPVTERDENLTAKLELEWPGILQWALDGAVAWYAQGLAPPAAVTKATTKYLQSENSFAMWLEDACEPDKDYWEPTKALYASWTGYAEDIGEKPGDQKVFAQLMETQGAEAKRKKHGRGFLGFRLTSAISGVTGDAR